MTPPLFPLLFPLVLTSVFYSQKIQMDYVTLKGIETRTGIKKDDLYTLILKEFLDNALDYLEIHSLNTSPQVDITITKEEDETLLRIIVRNSVKPNSNTIIFSKNMLQSIYDFSGYYSSKRIRKISRGALGDASKLILGIPYALARDMNMDIYDWNKVLTIRSNSSGMSSNNNLLQTFCIHLLKDRFNNEIKSVITEKNTKGNNTHSKYTEFKICLPQSMMIFRLKERYLDFCKIMFY